MGILHNKKPSFREHLEPILEYAQSQKNMNKTDLCREAGIELKRWSDFEKGRKTFTAYYFLKMIGGVDLTQETYEKATKSKFTDEQRDELKYQQFMEIKKEKYRKVMKTPKLSKLVDNLIDTYES